MKQMSLRTLFIVMVSEIYIDMITKVHIIVIANSFDWWFDSGAMVHVCNNEEQFNTYEESSLEQEVLMGNHNRAKVHGKGIVEVKMSSSKKLVLTNVFHVPNIKKNLVFANFLCKSGVKVVIESDKLILSNNEIFVGKRYVIDGMHKLIIINEDVSGCAYIVDSSYLWHARLRLFKFQILEVYVNPMGINSDSCSLDRDLIHYFLSQKQFLRNTRNHVSILQNCYLKNLTNLVVS